MKLNENQGTAEGVVLTARFKGPKSIVRQCCGLRFNDMILINGLVLEPFMFLRLIDHLQKLRREASTLDKSIYLTQRSIQEYKLKLPSLFVTLEGKSKNDPKAEINDSGNKAAGELVERQCEVLLVWNYDALHDSIKSEILRWRFLPESTDRSLLEDKRKLLSTFLVLRILDPVASKSPLSVRSFDDILIGFMSELADICESRVRRGSEVLSVSTPFHLKQFFNSWNSGIVSNVLGSQDALLLVDVDLAPGSEGTVLLRNDRFGRKQNLVGMMITSSCQFLDERVGLGLAVNFNSLVQDFLRKHKPNYMWKRIVLDDNSSSVTHENRIKDVLVEHLDTCIALISTEQSWGTGVVVSLQPDLILTCSHVVSQKQNISITIGNYKSSAKVVYSTPLGQVYDLALLSFKSSTCVKKIRIASIAPKLGEAVYAVGFPLLKSNQPSVTHGIISHVTKLAGPMLTSCCLHSGGSGAPLIRPDGSLLGIMTSFICSTDKNSINFPRLSLAISSAVFGSCLDVFSQTEDRRELLPLTSNDPEINRLWTISSPISLKSRL